MPEGSDMQSDIAYLKNKISNIEERLRSKDRDIESLRESIRSQDQLIDRMKRHHDDFKALIFKTNELTDKQLEIFKGFFEKLQEGLP